MSPETNDHGVQEIYTEGGPQQESGQLNLNNAIDYSFVMDMGLCNEKTHSNHSSEELILMSVELSIQNEYMKSQFEGLKHMLDKYQSGWRNEAMISQPRLLHEKLESLSIKLLEERQTRDAAEEALNHVRAAHLEADEKAQELSVKLVEAQQKMEQNLKERDERYTELDSKFNRLHKRAKQRIQEVQKEKDDIEAHLREINEKSERTSSQLLALQQELDRTRQHASDALKTMDVERQQLQSTNNKLRNDIEELRGSLVPKEKALESLQLSLLEKEQMLEDLHGLLHGADEKHQISLAEVSLKHQKQIESMEAQIADVLADRSKGTETISSLQALIAEKETTIAEMDAISSGEAARLKTSMETLKGELGHLKLKNEKEREHFEEALQSLKTKLEISESNRISAEVEAAKLRSQLESEHSLNNQLETCKDAELEEAKKKMDQVESEFASYKVRAHALLQKKDAELAAAKNNEQLKSQEEALKEAEKEIFFISVEKDQALQDLKDALTNSDKEIATRDAALGTSEQHIKSLQSKLDSLISLHKSDKESWDTGLQNVEETWRLRYEALEKQMEPSSGRNLEKELEELKLHNKKLKEQNTFHDLADKMIEEKDKEISRLLDENHNLNNLLESRPPAEYREDQSALEKMEPSNYNSSAAEQHILNLARQQAQREEELGQTQRHILALQEEIEELEHENRLHRQQEAMLKEEVREMERQQKREGVDMTYLKNVVFKLLETGEVERLLPVIAMLLQFSPDEMQKCQQAYRSLIDAPSSVASHTETSTRSLFSRFSFS